MVKSVGLASVLAGLITAVGSATPVRAGLPMTTCAPTSSVTGSGASTRTWLVFDTVGTCNYTLPTGFGGSAIDFDLVLVGGGGAGGWSDEDSASGGGGGGVALGTGLPLSGSITVTVGAGGTGHQSTLAPAGAAGGDSAIDGATFSVTAFGGGRGAGYGDGGPIGGGGSSAGAHAGYSTVVTATKGTSSGLIGIEVFGNNGGVSSDAATGGGGGGANAPGGIGGSGNGGLGGELGGRGGNGGQGKTISIAGTDVVLGSGGGGCGPQGNGTGGTNGGSGVDGAAGGDGVDGTGGGGGCSYNGPSGSGGSGLVVLSYSGSGRPTFDVPKLDRETLLGRPSTPHGGNLPNSGNLPSTGIDSPLMSNLVIAAMSVITLGVLLRRPVVRSKRR